MFPLLRAGVALRTALGLAFASDTVSIIIMEIVDNAVVLLIPGAMNAGLGTLIFWGSLALSLLIAGLAAFPVVRWLIARGRGHAVVHKYHTDERLRTPHIIDGFAPRAANHAYGLLPPKRPLFAVFPPDLASRHMCGGGPVIPRTHPTIAPRMESRRLRVGQPITPEQFDELTDEQLVRLVPRAYREFFPGKDFCADGHFYLHERKCLELLQGGLP